MSAERSFLRERSGHGHHRVTYVELFFDLVFVFAITQISHTQLAHFTPLGTLQTAVLFLAVWWVWIFTSWSTNWLDPERTPVRLALFALMVGGLLLSTSIPKAFDTRGLVFGCAVAAMQVGRTAFLVWSIPPSRAPLKTNCIRILAWLIFGGVFWIAGGFAAPQFRLVLWSIALAIEYASPIMNFYTPGYGRSRVSDWTVEGGHMAERCALFIIIALGESILVTGATFAEAAWTLDTILAFGSSFVGSIAMWWIYFHRGAEAGAARISATHETGGIARLAYTYLHLPIVAGIVICAVADEMVLAHPTGHTELKAAISLIGGPILFLGGALAFKLAIRGFVQLSHGVGLVALAVLIPVAGAISPLWLSLATSAILVVVGMWEALSLRSPAPGQAANT